MADSLYTLSDLAKINDQNLADVDISDLLQDAPLMAALSASTASNGTVHKYLKETGAPTVGFRAVNAGRDHSKSSDTDVSVNLKILDASFHVDKALADAYMKGGAAAMIAREAKRHLRAAFFAAEKQFINGTDNDGDGFTGFIDAATLNDLSQTETVIGAGGSANLSSVYLIRTGDDDVSAVMGQDGNIVMGESLTQFVEDSSGKKFPAYMTPITGWLGLQVGSKYSIIRIANIDAGSNVVTDDLIYQALSLFPVGRQPNLIAMNRRSLRQLRESRTSTNAIGAPAPRPTEIDGISIVATDGILNTETAVA